jgi:energy-coupling factor transporter ATP-binding protein EcfA2
MVDSGHKALVPKGFSEREASLVEEWGIHGRRRGHDECLQSSLTSLAHRISELRIESFRGVPKTLTIDLRPRKDATPSSLLLLGDNGSGKSSVADALEFVLRASLMRRLDPDRPTRRHAQSFATTQTPYAEILFEDGARIARGAPGSTRYGSGVRRITRPEPSFSLAPLVLRRADIVGFWGVPPDRRKLVFFDYFRPPDLTSAQRLEASRQAEKLEKRIPTLRERLDVERRNLEAVTGLDLRRIPRRARRLRGFRQSVLVRDFGTGRTGRFGESLIQLEVQRPYRRALDAALEVERAESTHALFQERAKGASASRVQAEMEDILAQAGDYVTRGFREVSTSASFVDEVRLETARDSNALEVVVRLANGQETSPDDVLSEANLDLLSLLLFTAVAEASVSHGQARVLVFDDVFQSVDSVFRERVARYVLRQLREWQLFITTHDRLWFSLLADGLRQQAIQFIPREIVRWSFEAGPVVRDARLLPSASLDVATDATDPVLICSSAGVLLEEICDRLSWTLGTSVHRARGDRYTLGELWPGVRKKLLKTSAASAIEAVDATVALRNIVGAHFNEWGQSVSMEEATDFGVAIKELLSRVFCSSCQSWILPGLRDATAWECRCGTTSLEAT